MAHLHLALALETAGDRPSARRAFAAAHHVLITTEPAQLSHSIEGYTIDELRRFLSAKQQVGAP